MSNLGGPDLDLAHFEESEPGFRPIWGVGPGFWPILGGPSLDFGPFGRSGPGFGPILEGLTHMRGVRPGFGPILEGHIRVPFL